MENKPPSPQQEKKLPKGPLLSEKILGRIFQGGGGLRFPLPVDAYVLIRECILLNSAVWCVLGYILIKFALKKIN